MPFASISASWATTNYRPASAVTAADAGAGRGSLIDVDILGHIFEQSITDLEKLRDEVQGKIDPPAWKNTGPAVREKGHFTHRRSLPATSSSKLLAACCVSALRNCASAIGRKRKGLPALPSTTPMPSILKR